MSDEAKYYTWKEYIIEWLKALQVVMDINFNNIMFAFLNVTVSAGWRKTKSRFHFAVMLPKYGFNITESNTYIYRDNVGCRKALGFDDGTNYYFYRRHIYSNFYFYVMHVLGENAQYIPREMKDNG